MQSGLVLMARLVVLGALAATLSGAPAVAIMGRGDGEQAPASGDDFANGRAAFEREDWQSVIEHMTKVLAEQPWHDDAHNLMGFAYRKLGDYDKALEAYDDALKLNPHHRGALEYLGEAYLELDRPELAKATLDRLAAECQQIVVGATDGGWQSGCEEWQELNAAYEAYLSIRDGE